MLLAVVIAVAVVHHVVHAQVATCPPAPRGRGGVWPGFANPSCTLNGKTATCELFLLSTRPVNCTDPSDVDTCYHYRSACVAKDVSCFNANSPKNCVVNGIAGRCTLDAYGLFYDCLPLGDSAPCTRAADGLPCALAGETDVCWLSSDVEQIACGEKSGAARDACVAQLGDDAFVCDVNVYCAYGSPGNDERCVTSGFVGKCKSHCYEDSFGDKYCPIDETLDALSDNQLAEWCAFVQRPLEECRAALDETCSTLEPYCVAGELGIGVDAPQCVLDERVCSAAGAICLESGNVGVCRSNGTALACVDGSDACPRGAPCELSDYYGSPSLVRRIGVCSSTFECEPKHEECDYDSTREPPVNTSQVCFDYGLPGKCAASSFLSFDYAVCVLDDTLPCNNASTLHATCVDHGNEGTCDVVDELRRLACANNSYSDECAETVAARFASSVVCDVWQDCEYLAHGDECHEAGLHGVCEKFCEVRNEVDDKAIKIECIGDDSMLAVNASVARAYAVGVCALRFGNSDEKVIQTCADDAVVYCQDYYNYVSPTDVSVSCLLSELYVSVEAQCVRNARPCTNANDWCIEHNNVGLCEASANNGSLVCVEDSDSCPPGSSCDIESTIGSGNATSRVSLYGVCNHRFECVARDEPCGSHSGDSCYVRGELGRCIHKSTSQRMLFDRCVQRAPTLVARRECVTRYSTCFLGCRYPNEQCGAAAACVWPLASSPAMRQEKRQLGQTLVATDLTCESIANSTSFVPPRTFQGEPIMASFFGYANRDTTRVPLIDTILSYSRAIPDLDKWAAVIAENDTAVHLTLLPTGVVDRLRYERLDLIIKVILSQRPPLVAFVYVNGQSPSAPSSTAASTMPGESTVRTVSKCAAVRCRPYFSCEDGHCIRRLTNGVCIDDLPCVCNGGFIGEECDERAPTPDASSLLSQWIFSSPPETYLSSMAFVRAVLETNVRSLSPNELVVTASVAQPMYSIVVVKVSTNFKEAVTSNSVAMAELRQAWQLLRARASLVTFTAVAPTLDNVVAAPVAAHAASLNNAATAAVLLACAVALVAM